MTHKFLRAGLLISQQTQARNDTSLRPTLAAIDQPRQKYEAAVTEAFTRLQDLHGSSTFVLSSFCYIIR